jgi:RNA polymerase sigma factor (sigma-70 family)
LLPFADLFAEPSPERSPEEAALVREEMETALRLLANFPDEQRRVLELRWAGLSGQEIAAVLGKRYDAVRKIESRAELRLRALQEQEARDGD